MRRIAALLVVPLLAAGVLAGCGGSSPSGDANAQVSVTGKYGQAPSVKIPAQQASSQLLIKTPIRGSGPPLQTGDAVLGNIAIYRWRGHSHDLLESTFAKGGPQLLPASIGLTGLQKALHGQRIGTRVVAVLPPKYGYGAQGNTNIGIKGTDTTVWVVDMIKLFKPTAAASGKNVSAGGGALPKVSAGPGGAPDITIPAAQPPSKLITKTLIQGSGPPLKTGQTVVAQVVGTNWRTKKVFYTTWPSASSPTGALFSFQLGGQVIKGWNDALPGQHVGSRVMLVVPPAEGYGSAGYASAGIKGHDTLVFVVDILDAVS
jgi:FKBP-type peptidyl-prolyl cis-trans isomerase